MITNYTTDASLVKHKQPAALAQLGERQTEDLKVPGSIPGGGTPFGSQSLSVALGSMLPIGFT